MAVNALHVRVCAGLHSCCLLTFEYLKTKNKQTTFYLDCSLVKFVLISSKFWAPAGWCWNSSECCLAVFDLTVSKLVTSVTYGSSGPLGVVYLWIIVYALFPVAHLEPLGWSCALLYGGLSNMHLSIKNPQLSAACLTWSWTRKMSVWLSADTMLLVLVVLQTQGCWYYSTMQ